RQMMKAFPALAAAATAVAHAMPAEAQAVTQQTPKAPPRVQRPPAPWRHRALLSSAARGEGDDLRGHRSRHRRPWPRGHRDDGLLAAADAEFSAWHSVHPDFRDGPEDPGQSDGAVAGVTPEYCLQERHRHLRRRLAGEDGATNAGAAAKGNRIRQEMD